MELLTLDVEKAAAGGRMLARHLGQVVLVSGAIPGERVAARLERTAKGVTFAETVDVLSASADRRPVVGDPRCGGNVFAHIDYPRQLALKAEIIHDAFARIGRVAFARLPVIIGSPERGYRMRARLHAKDGRIGFYLEGTHHLCDVNVTGQLLPATATWIAAIQEVVQKQHLTGLTAIELAENVTGAERACHIEVQPGVDLTPFAALGEGLVGLSAQRADRPDITRLAGSPVVRDIIRAGDDTVPTLDLRRDVRAFFQGNRFLLEPLVRHVSGLVPQGPVLDLYAGVGLFGLALAATGREPVTLVEGDRVCGADLVHNAAPFGDRVTVHRCSVERSFALPYNRRWRGATVLVDPPRTGLSREAIDGVLSLSPSRVVYVSCDVATLARDSRLLIDAGYRLADLSGIDLFPNTAHVETVAAFTR